MVTYFVTRDGSNGLRPSGGGYDPDEIPGSQCVSNVVVVYDSICKTSEPFYAYTDTTKVL